MVELGLVLVFPICVHPINILRSSPVVCVGASLFRSVISMSLASRLPNTKGTIDLSRAPHCPQRSAVTPATTEPTTVRSRSYVSSSLCMRDACEVDAGGG